MPMKAFDQIRVDDKGEDYQLGDSACACVHNDVSNEDECVQHYVSELYRRVSSVVPDD